MKKIVIRLLILGIVIAIAILAVDFYKVRQAALARFKYYEDFIASTETSYGKMSYIDLGSGEPILSIHGICTGCDQGYDTLSERVDSYRIIAPSRFGYSGSDMPQNATVDMQVEAFVELLDQLGIEKTFVLGTSAGGTSATRFALMYPGRCKGLILYCAGVPSLTKPKEPASYAGPPGFFCNDFCMWLISPLFKPIMGIDKDKLKEILPMKNKKQGIIFDGAVTNTDKTNNYDKYDLHELKVPIIIFHSEDDKLAKGDDEAQAWCEELDDCSLVSFPEGGHMMEGHSEEISKALDEFVMKYSQ